MISKSKFLDWKSNEVTQRFIEILERAREESVSALIQSENSEFRGAIKNFDELLIILKTGDIIVDLDEEEET